MPPLRAITNFQPYLIAAHVLEWHYRNGRPVGRWAGFLGPEQAAKQSKDERGQQSGQKQKAAQRGRARLRRFRVGHVKNEAVALLWNGPEFHADDVSKSLPNLRYTLNYAVFGNVSVWPNLVQQVGLGHQ